MKLPDKFVSSMEELLGDHAGAFFASMELDSVKALTLDTNKVSEEEYESCPDVEIEKIPYIDNAYYYRGKIGASVWHHMGVVYSQDASAMLPVLALDVEMGDVVLDICSAPGGKSIQILEKLNNTGLLISNEYVYARAKILYENLTRFGYCNYAITNNIPSDFDKKLQCFDKILVDAPCSGEGMFRKSDIDTYTWNEKNVETCAVRQLEILNSVAGTLREGGTLVYSTCTYNKLENEGVVVQFLNQHPEYRLVELPSIVKDNTTRGVIVDKNYDTSVTGRRYPHLHKGEGQFIAKFIKLGESERIENKTELDKYYAIGKKDRQLVDNALHDIVNVSTRSIYRKGDNLYVAPQIEFDYSGLNVLTLGVCMGSIDGKDIKLNHSFYKSACAEFLHKIDLKTDQAKTYLTGNVVDNLNRATDGIVVVTYKGVPLGGGKVVKGVLKNYYPKELRNK